MKMLPTRIPYQGLMIGMLVIGTLGVVVGPGWAAKHTLPPGPLPPEMKTQPGREAPRIPTAPGEQKQYPTPQPPQKVDPSRPVIEKPVMEKIDFDLVRVTRVWSEPDRVTNGQTARVRMEIHNVSSRELRNVAWRIRKIVGLGAFDSGMQSVAAIGAGRTAVVAVDWAATLETLGGHSFEGSVEVAGDRLPGNNKGVVTLAVDRRTITKKLIAQQVEGPSWFTKENVSTPTTCNYGMGYNDGNPEFSIYCGPGVGWRINFQVYRLAPDLINGWVVSRVELGLPSYAESSRYRLAEWVTRPAGASLNGELKTLIDPLNRDHRERPAVGGQVLIWVTGPEGLPLLPPRR